MKYAVKVIKLLLFVSLFLALGSIALAQDFSAQIVSKSEDDVFQGKIFFTKDKVRMETGQVITITRMDKNIMWMLMPDEKMYMEMPMPSQNIVAGKDKMPGEIERKLVGKEAVDGKMADKYRIVYELGNKKETIFTWIINNLNLPIKTASSDGSWQVEYKNIKTGRQPAVLFEIPAGYNKFSPKMPSLSDIGGMLDIGF